MNRFKMTMLGAAVAGVTAFVAPASAQNASDEIVAAINAVEMPKYDSSRRSDTEYRAQFSKDYAAAQKAKADLILRLYETDPNHDLVPELMPQRWQMISRTPGGADTVLEEAGKIVKTAKGEFAIEACYTYASTIGQKTRYAEDEFMPALEHFIKMAPEDDRPAQLLMTAARYCGDDTERELAIYKRVLAEYPDARAARYTAGKIKQVEGLKKPFKLEFNEATSGETISMKNLRGKVVVIDFWATWCGPCIAELPHMKDLYAEYSDKGVEFIGVSLDQPENEDPSKDGLKKLRDYCAENNIAWPQYYQGNYWDSEFSTSWGINSIPAIFVVDQKGNLHSVNARGKLDDMIPEMLGIDKPEKLGGDG